MILIRLHVLHKWFEISIKSNLALKFSVLINFYDGTNQRVDALWNKSNPYDWTLDRLVIEHMFSTLLFVVFAWWTRSCILFIFIHSSMKTTNTTCFTHQTSDSPSVYQYAFGSYINCEYAVRNNPYIISTKPHVFWLTLILITQYFWKRINKTNKTSFFVYIRFELVLVKVKVEKKHQKKIKLTSVEKP